MRKTKEKGGAKGGRSGGKKRKTKAEANGGRWRNQKGLTWKAGKAGEAEGGGENGKGRKVARANAKAGKLLITQTEYISGKCGRRRRKD